VEGILFIIMSLTNIREAIFNAIPKQLKTAVSVGIGFFITFIGLQNSHVIVDSSTLVGLYSLKASLSNGLFFTEGITVILTLIGVIITAWLLIKGVKGYMLYGILITWVLGILCQLTGLYVPDPSIGFYSVIPTKVISLPDLSVNMIFQFDFAFIAEHFLDFVVMTFAFMFVDVFDTLGTVIGCATKADMLDEDGKLPGIRGVLLADAVGTTVGACLGTSTITTFVESSSGIAEGGRTGLTTVTTGILFLVSLIISPLFLTIPSFATAPALILVGFLMFSTISELKVDEENYSEAIPAYLCVIAMPLFYSISEGISIGIISYVVINLACGKAKKISPLMYVLAVLFILKYILL
jgi:AGZA family xanthine/uracil permease-like MFS transporter